MHTSLRADTTTANIFHTGIFHFHFKCIKVCMQGLDTGISWHFKDVALRTLE